MLPLVKPGLVSGCSSLDTWCLLLEDVKHNGRCKNSLINSRLMLSHSMRRHVTFLGPNSDMQHHATCSKWDEWFWDPIEPDMLQPSARFHATGPRRWHPPRPGVFPDTRPGSQRVGTGRGRWARLVWCLFQAVSLEVW